MLKDSKIKEYKIIINTKKSSFVLLKKKLLIYYILFRYLLIILFSIILLKIIMSRKIKYDDYEYDDDIKPSIENIYLEEKFDSYQDAFNKAKDFIDNCSKGILINKDLIKPIKKPKISIVIPCYNCKGYILKALRSIQNQDFNNLEIVIINDFSCDETLSYLEQLKFEDPRIKILSNKKNMGTLYTRSIGSLSAIGKYIFTMDSDDMFLDKDVFSTISNIADKGNFDLVVFHTIHTKLTPNVYSTSYRIFNNKKERKANLVLFQPDLGYYPILPVNNSNSNLNFIEVYIFSRCIRTKIYKKALNKLGEERYSRYMLLDEDVIANYILFNTARSMKYISKFGYIYVKRPGSIVTRSWDKVNRLIYRIFMLDDLIVFAQDSFKHKKIIVILTLYCLKNDVLKNILQKDEYYYKLFISCLEQILICKYISDKDKKEIRNKIKTLDFIKFNVSKGI
jgi:glycosyltransferase involved in cell wall biosynthesis